MPERAKALMIETDTLANVSAFRAVRLRQLYESRLGLRQTDADTPGEDPGDLEICQFIVALSRTRKQCHLVSAKRVGSEWAQPSLFLRWVRDQSVERAIDKTYWV